MGKKTISMGDMDDLKRSRLLAALDSTDDMSDLLGLADSTDDALIPRSKHAIKDEYPTIDFFNEKKTMKVHRVKVSCHMMDGADLMKRGFSNIVPISAYGVVLTKESKTDDSDSPLVELDYEIVPLMSKVFDMKTLFLVLDEIMTRLEDYTPHIELY